MGSWHKARHMYLYDHERRVPTNLHDISFIRMPLYIMVRLSRETFLEEKARLYMDRSKCMYRTGTGRMKKQQNNVS